jgi:signal transduction histidine kinase
VTGEEKAPTEAFDHFVAIISHELRVPMMAILGWAEILGDRQIDPATLAMAAGVIKRNARFQADLIKELLDYSTVANEKLSLSLRAVSLQVIIESTIESLIPISSEKLIDLEMYSDLNSEMDGDPLRLQ